MLFQAEYLTSARRMIDAGETMGGKPGAALIRLAGDYLRRVADGLAPIPEALNENEAVALKRTN